MKKLEIQMKVYFHFFRLIGQFPFKITDEGLSPSTPLKVCGIVPTIVLVIIAIYVAFSHITSLDSAREIMLRLAFFLLGVGLFVATIIIPILKSNFYCSVFYGFNRVEEYFRCLGITIEERKNTFEPLLILFKHLFTAGVIIISDYFFPYWATINLPFYGMIFYWMVMIIMTFLTANCETFAHLTVTRYNAINNKLENMDKTVKSNKIFPVNKILDNRFIDDLYQTKKLFHTHQSSIYPTMNMKKTVDTAANVRLLQKSHHELYGLCNNLAGIFTFPIVLTVFFTGCEVLFTCYMGFGNVVNHKVVNLYDISSWFKYMIYDLFRVLSICKAFSSIEQSGNKTSYDVHGLILNTKDSNVREDLKTFSQQLLHQKVNFSTGGLFKLDMSLLVSMAGAITTYVVILLQFSGKKKADLSNDPNKT